MLEALGHGANKMSNDKPKLNHLHLTTGDSKKSQTNLLILQYPYSIPIGNDQPMDKNRTPTETPLTEDEKRRKSRLALVSLQLCMIVIMAIVITIQLLAMEHDVNWKLILSGEKEFPNSQNYIGGKRLNLQNSEAPADLSSSLESAAYKGLTRDDKNFGEVVYVFVLFMTLATIILSIFPLWIPMLMNTRNIFVIIFFLYTVLGLAVGISSVGVVISAQSIQKGYESCFINLHNLSTSDKAHNPFKETNSRDLPDQQNTTAKIYFQPADAEHDPIAFDHVMDPEQSKSKLRTLEPIEVVQNGKNDDHLLHHTGSFGARTVHFNNLKILRETELLSVMCYICGNSGIFKEHTKVANQLEKNIRKIIIHRNDLDVEDPRKETFDYDTLRKLYICQHNELKLATAMLSILVLMGCFTVAISSLRLLRWVYKSADTAFAREMATVHNIGQGDNVASREFSSMSTMEGSTQPSVTDAFVDTK